MTEPAFKPVIKEGENLNKENFFNKAMELLPNATRGFCIWIDEYKKTRNWNILFNDGVRAHQYVKGPMKHTKAPKFHDLPIEMQFGILAQFVHEHVDELTLHPLVIHDLEWGDEETIAYWFLGNLEWLEQQYEEGAFKDL